jgi:hypothetical protein
MYRNLMAQQIKNVKIASFLSLVTPNGPDFLFVDVGHSAR